MNHNCMSDFFSLFPLEETIGKIVAATQKRTSAERVIVAAFRNSHIYFLGGYGVELPPQRIYAMREDFIGYTALANKLIEVDEDSARLFHKSHRAYGDNIREVLAHPSQNHQGANGVLAIINSQKGGFTARDLKTLTSMSRLLSSVISAHWDAATTDAPAKETEEQK